MDRLEAGGWVRRRRHPSDRRYMLVGLSSQASERTPAALAAYHAQLAAIAAAVPRAHQDAIRGFLLAAAEAAAAAATGLRR
jgi:DNA-binding MarR family transcriptional regulator